MSIIFWANIAAMLFSFFVVGAILGVLFSELFRQKVIASIPPSFLSLLTLLQKKLKA